MRLRMYDIVPLVGATLAVVVAIVWDQWLAAKWREWKQKR
jgi:hypothetical protein